MADDYIEPPPRGGKPGQPIAPPPPQGPEEPTTLPPGWKFEPLASSATAPLPSGWKFESSQGQAQPPSGEGGFWENLWNGLSGKSSTFGGGMGMGIADPAVGAAQIAARQYISPTEGGEIDIGPEQTSAAIDPMVRAREQQYQAGRAAAGRPGFDAARLIGNVVSPVNLAAGAAAGAGPAQAATLGPRLIGGAASGAAAGGAAGAMQPVTGPNYAREQLGRLPLDMLTGGALGAAGRGFFGPRPAPGGPEQINNAFGSAIGFPTRGVNAQSDLAALQQAVPTVVRDIAANKGGLNFVDETGGEIRGALPESRAEFLDAISQGKDRLFKTFDNQVKEADASSVPLGASPINKFNRAFENAQLEQSQARLALTQARADLAFALQRQADPQITGSAATSASRDAARAESAINMAEKRLKETAEKLETAKADATRPWVDLKPIAREMQQIADDTVIRNKSSTIANYAADRARTYGEQEAYTAQEAQRAIKQFNVSLKAFYDNPSYDSAAHAAVDAKIAQAMRSSLDDMVSKATGQEYQAFKNLYGAYSSIEKQVARAAVKAANNPQAQSMLGRIMGGDVVGILTTPHHPTAWINIAGIIRRAMKDPDRQVQAMFQNAERGMGPPAPSVAERAGQGIGRLFSPDRPARTSTMGP